MSVDGADRVGPRARLRHSPRSACQRGGAGRILGTPAGNQPHRNHRAQSPTVGKSRLIGRVQDSLGQVWGKVSRLHVGRFRRVQDPGRDDVQPASMPRSKIEQADGGDIRHSRRGSSGGRLPDAARPDRGARVHALQGGVDADLRTVQHGAHDRICVRALSGHGTAELPASGHQARRLDRENLWPGRDRETLRSSRDRVGPDPLVPGDE